MNKVSRLNVLLTRPARPAWASTDANARPDWPDLVRQLLAPLQVQTFMASSGSDALALAQRHVMHVAVVDAQLPPGNQPALDPMTVLRLMNRLSRPISPEQVIAEYRAPDRRLSTMLDATATEAGPEARPESGREDTASRQIPVRGLSTGFSGEIRPQQAAFTGHPLVILLVRQTEDRVIREALRQDVFSVLPEPLEVNDLLDVMARALQRFYGGGWPQ